MIVHWFHLVRYCSEYLNQWSFSLIICLPLQLLKGKRIYPPELILENSYLCRYIKDEPLDWYFDPDLCLLASLSDYQRLVLRNEVSMCINYFQLSNASTCHLCAHAAGNQFLLLFNFEWVAAIFCFMGIWMHFLFFLARIYASNLQVLGPELLGEMQKWLSHPAEIKHSLKMCACKKLWKIS